MDYNQIQATFDKCGISLDPAITRAELLIRIDELPPEFRKQALGLYYPDESRIWVPPEADEETVKHEAGHALCHYHNNDVGEQCAEAFRRRVNMKSVALRERLPSLMPVRRAPVKQSGKYTTIVKIEAPASAAPGASVMVSATVRNDYQDTIHVNIVGLVSTNRFIDEFVRIPSGYQITYSGSFIMPSAGSIVAQIVIWYEAEDGQWYTDSETGSVTINSQAEGAYQIPSTFTLQRYIVYPGAASHVGDQVSMATFAFTAPLTVIPGVDWVVGQILGRYVSACMSNNAIPLELRIYTEPAQFGSTNYIVQAVAYSNVAARSAVSFALPVVAWVAIGLFVMAFIYFETKSITTLIYGPEIETEKTIDPVTVTLSPGQSFSNTSAVPFSFYTPRGAVVTDSVGNKTTVAAGQKGIVPPGGVVVDGGGGGTAIDIPGGKEYTKGPANPKGLAQTSDIIKYAAIGLGVFAVGALGVMLLKR